MNFPSDPTAARGVVTANHTYHAQRIREILEGNDLTLDAFAAANVALDSLVAAVTELQQRAEQAERERDELEATFKRNLRLGTDEIRRDRAAAEARVGALTRQVERIRENALSWHGNEGLGTGHARALAVIAKWCDAVLAAGDGTTPTGADE